MFYCDYCQSRSCLHVLNEEVDRLRDQHIELEIVLQSWLDKQGEDRCWFFPEIFMKLCNILELRPTVLPCLPERSSFEKGCKRYQDEQYDKQ